MTNVVRKPSIFVSSVDRRVGLWSRLTASIGFSVANLDNLADSSALFSGGKKRSRRF